MRFEWDARDIRDPQCLDPYLRWAQASLWRGLGRHTRSDQLPTSLRFLARAPAGQYPAICKEPRWSLPALYPAPSPAQAEFHFTGEFAFRHLAWMLGNPHGIRWELAVPFRDAKQHPVAQVNGLQGLTRDAKVFQIKQSLPAPQRSARSKAKGAPGNRGAIAVIDFGCPFLNRRFEDSAGGTRLHALWDQGSKPSGRWLQASHNLPGRQLAKRDIDSLLRLVRQPDLAWDEARVYKKLDHLIDYDDPRRRVWGHTHGAHVLDVAGGSVDPLTRGEDAASKAPLLFVQLPALTASDASGSSLGACLLEGVRWCMQQVPDGEPLIVNISYGGQAGPNNGQSSLERALDALLLERPENFAIVMGAGNAGGQKIHAHRLVQPDHSGLFRARLATRDATDSFIECWYALPAKGSMEVRVRALAGSAGGWSRWLPAGEAAVLNDAAGHIVAMARHSKDQPNGDGGMLLLSFAPTLATAHGDGVVAPAGVWEIEWQLNGADEVRVDAWIERDDAGAYTGEISEWLDADVSDRSDCLSNIAGGALTVAVAAMCRSNGQTLAYASLSPRKATLAQRFVRAAAEDSEDLPGFVAAAVRSLESHRMNGSSVAAPVVARRLFNQFAAGQPDVDQALRAIVKHEKGAPTRPAVRE